MIWFKNFLTPEQFRDLLRDVEECAREIARLDYGKSIGAEPNYEEKKAIAKEKLRTIFNQLIDKL